MQYRSYSCIFLPQSLSNGRFKGDAPELVDALIQASRIPAVAKNASPSLFGRELVPWQADSVPCSPGLDQALEHKRSASGNMFATGSVQVQKAVARRARKNSRPPTTGSPSLPMSHSGCLGEAFACPALAHAPRPESVPMPTFGLLSRAGTRSRSPSPPKDAFNGNTLHISYAQPFVSPVAA